MLDGPSSVSLQVAEYKDSSKCGSFTPLSSSLGQILMQLHKGSSREFWNLYALICNLILEIFCLLCLCSKSLSDLFFFAIVFIGIIHLIVRETHSGLLALLLRILMLLISSTPYEFSFCKLMLISIFYFFNGITLCCFASCIYHSLCP